MVTADSITDEQIRELYANRRDYPDEVRVLCKWALERGHVQRHAARARLAEILNARAKEDKQP